MRYATQTGDTCQHLVRSSIPSTRTSRSRDRKSSWAWAPIANLLRTTAAAVVRVARWLTAVFVVSLNAMGCGHDDAADTTPLIAGAEAGTSGRGAGGAAAPTLAQCVAQTNAANMSGCSAECVSCACTAPADRVTLLVCDASCWAILKCSTRCGPTDLPCVLATCDAEIKAAGKSVDYSLLVDMVLRGGACSSKCVKPPDDPEACD
jgi:hypothetical protein